MCLFIVLRLKRPYFCMYILLKVELQTAYPPLNARGSPTKLRLRFSRNLYLNVTVV